MSRSASSPARHGRPVGERVVGSDGRVLGPVEVRHVGDRVDVAHPGDAPVREVLPREEMVPLHRPGGGDGWIKQVADAQVAEQRLGIEEVQRGLVRRQHRRPGRGGVEPVRQRDVPVVGGERGPHEAVEFVAEGSPSVGGLGRCEATEVGLDLGLVGSCVAARGVGHEEPAGDDAAKGLAVEAEITSADQPQNVCVDQSVLRGQHAAAAEPRMGEALEELVPVAQVKDLVLRFR